MKTALFLIFVLLAVERTASTFSKKEPEGEVKYEWLTRLLVFTYTFSAIIAASDFLFFNKALKPIYTAAGFIVMLAGAFLRKSAIKALGPAWSMHTKIIKGQKLVRSGPYKVLKHPYYVAVMFELTGIAVYFNSLSALVFVLAVHLPFLLVRVHLENKMLADYFGSGG